MRKRSLLLVFVVMALVFLHACGAGAVQKAGVTEGTVKNFTYRLSFGEEGTFTLKDGNTNAPTQIMFTYGWIIS